MRLLLKRYGKDDSGAVTTEFVVITAALISLGLAVMATIADGTLDTTATIGADLETDTDISFPARTD